MSDSHERTDRRARPRRGRGWLKANWNPELGLVEWRNKLIESGWGAPHWPEGMVRPRPAGEVQRRRRRRVRQDRRRHRRQAPASARWPPRPSSTTARDLHKEKFLRRILTGEDTWCQLFSEPGSRLGHGGAITRADKKGNKWIINGQKVWTTSAHKADWGLLLARTDWDAPKHKGLSYFLLDMHQPGVQVQPLKQMNGHASFNQVFFTDAEVEPEMLMGDVGDGWTVATTTLMHERRGADGLRTWAQASNRKGRIYEEEKAEIATTMEPYKWYPQRAGRVDLRDRARQGHRQDRRPGGAPGDRQAADHVEVGRMDGAPRPRRAERRAGRRDRRARSASSRRATSRAAARVHTYITGADALLTGEDSPMDGVIAEILVSVPGHLDRRRHRRDPAQHHLRARAEDAEGAQRRHQQAVQGRAEEHRSRSRSCHPGGEVRCR